MKKQKLGSLWLLGLLFLLAVAYSAHVFVYDNSGAKAATEVVDQQEDSGEKGEENVKETSNFLLFIEKLRYHLKPITNLSVNKGTYIFYVLSDAYTQLNTPPPDFT